ncbi:MAG: hypothetical protein AB7O57_05475 [Hyphomicrobiaceae bacterium]
MKLEKFIVQLAPARLFQDINRNWFQGANFNWLSVDLGLTPRPGTEQSILDEVGSYGRQLGRMGDVVEILLRHLDRSKLTDDERDAIAVFEGQQAHIRRIKRREQGKA